MTLYDYAGKFGQPYQKYADTSVTRVSGRREYAIVFFGSDEGARLALSTHSTPFRRSLGSLPSDTAIMPKLDQVIADREELRQSSIYG